MLVFIKGKGHICQSILIKVVLKYLTILKCIKFRNLLMRYLNEIPSLRCFYYELDEKSQAKKALGNKWFSSCNQITCKAFQKKSNKNNLLLFIYLH